MSKKDESKKELAAPNSLPSLAVDIGGFAGAGMEHTDKDSFSIPFLKVLQKISPECDEAEAKYIPGAKANMFLNTVTQELYDGKEGIIILPCAFQRRFLRWGPRGSEGAGFKGELLPEEVAQMQDNGQVVEIEGRLYVVGSDGKADAKKCDRLSDTRTHYVLLVDGERITQAILALSSTQIKKSKQLMSLLSSVKVKGANGLVTPPTWANKVRLTTVAESNDKGSWYGIRPTLEGFVDSQALFDAGAEFHKLIESGAAKADYAKADGEEAQSDKDSF